MPHALHPTRILSALPLPALLVAALCTVTAAASAEEVIYKVKWKDREFHLVGSQPYRMEGEPLNQNLFKLIDEATAVAVESNFADSAKAAENLDLAVKAGKLMPAKSAPEALKAKFRKAMAKADPKGGSPDFYLSAHLLDTALAIRAVSAPYPEGSMPMGTDNLVLIRATVKKTAAIPLLNVTEYYESFSQVPRTAIEEFIDLAAGAVLDAGKWGEWKAAHARCYEAQLKALPTPAYEACTRDLNQKLKVPEAWLRGYYDQRNPLLVDKLLAVVEKQPKLVVSLNHVHLGGQAGVLNLLRQKGATAQRIFGGPPGKQ